MNTSSSDVDTEYGAPFECIAISNISLELVYRQLSQMSITVGLDEENNAGFEDKPKLQLEVSVSYPRTPQDHCLPPRCRHVSSCFLWLLKRSSNDSVTERLSGPKIVSQNPITALHELCPLHMCPQPSKFFNL